MSYVLASDSWGTAEVEALKRVIASGRYTMGSEVAAFEREFAEYVGAPFAVMVNSGSSANLLMVAACSFRQQGRRLEPGSEVLVPAVSWSTTYYPLTQYGLKLRFVDIDLDTLNLAPSALAEAITPSTSGIMAVNLLGNPNKFDEVAEVARQHDLILLEDNCESLGATYNGKQAGTFGLAGSFSFFFSHHMSTMEGGMVVTADEELHQLLVSLRAHGWTRGLPPVNLVSGEKDADPFVESYNFVLPGYNVRPIEFEAAVGREQLRKLPDFIRVRRENAQRFCELMKNDGRFRIQQEVGESSWFGFSLIVEPAAGASRRDIVTQLTRRGIESRPIVAGDFTQNPVMRYLPHSIAAPLHNAAAVHERGFFVGNQERSLNKELDHLIDALTRF